MDLASPKRMQHKLISLLLLQHVHPLPRNKFSIFQIIVALSGLQTSAAEVNQQPSHTEPPCKSNEQATIKTQ
jgi:hypothetical protein